MSASQRSYRAGDQPRSVVRSTERPEGGLRYYDVWESEQDWDRFAEERLHPVVHPLLGGLFGDDCPPEPPRTPLPAIHVWLADGPALKP